MLLIIGVPHHHPLSFILLLLAARRSLLHQHTIRDLSHYIIIKISDDDKKFEVQYDEIVKIVKMCASIAFLMSIAAKFISVIYSLKSGQDACIGHLTSYDQFHKLFSGAGILTMFKLSALYSLVYGLNICRG